LSFGDSIVAASMRPPAHSGLRTHPCGAVLAMLDSPESARRKEPRRRRGHGWSRSSRWAMAAASPRRRLHLGERVTDVNAGRLLSAEERLVAPRVLGRLPSVAGRDAARGRSRVPIDPCCSPLPAPTVRHYYLGSEDLAPLSEQERRRGHGGNQPAPASTRRHRRGPSHRMWTGRSSYGSSDTICSWPYDSATTSWPGRPGAAVPPAGR
jgi:hypothetical protein